MIHCVLLELFFIDLQLLQNGLHFGVDDLLFFLRHLDHDLLEGFFVNADLASFLNKVFLFGCKLGLGLGGANLEYLNELIKIDIALSISLE